MVRNRISTSLLCVLLTLSLAFMSMPLLALADESAPEPESTEQSADNTATDDQSVTTDETATIDESADADESDAADNADVQTDEPGDAIQSDDAQGDELQGVSTLAPESELATLADGTDTIRIPITVWWDDAENMDNIRPSSITVRLIGKTEDGKTVMTKRVSVTNKQATETDTWEGAVAGLPATTDDGKEITYSLDEGNLDIDGYFSISWGSQTDGFHIWYTASVTIDVQKVWNDADDWEGIRPSEVTTRLTATYVEDGETKTFYPWWDSWNNRELMTLTEENGWAGSYVDLYRYHSDSGNYYPVTYSIEETDVPEGYTVKYSHKATKTGELWTVTNTHEVESTEVSVQKVWKDAGNAYNTRPAAITLHVKGAVTYPEPTVMDEGATAGDQTEVVYEKDFELTAEQATDDANVWADVLSLPARTTDGYEVTYEVTEEAVENYASTCETAEDGSVTITNELDESAMGDGSEDGDGSSAPGDESDEADGASVLPDTGDYAPLVLGGVILLAALALIGTTVYRRTRNRTHGKHADK